MSLIKKGAAARRRNFWPKNQAKRRPKDLGSNPEEGMVVCKCIVPSRHRSTLNSRRAASSLVRLVEGEESNGSCRMRVWRCRRNSIPNCGTPHLVT
ncbi:hypothetical protein TNCV_4928901 [Trichonephila clavipes]|nr:hypothetical protein TNCV_4928901 [Trichonephila clavipes]